jgi:hypothetical protein
MEYDDSDVDTGETIPSDPVDIPAYEENEDENEVTRCVCLQSGMLTT